MASFYAELHVDGRVYPLLSCTYSMHQATDGRGRVITKTYDSPVALSTPVPRDSFLAAWAADPYKRCAADLVFKDAKGGQALETLHLAGAYCVHYGTHFRQGSYLGESQQTLSSYVTQLTLTDPDGYHWQPGGPGTYQAPAARTHGVPGPVGTQVAAPLPAAGQELRAKQQRYDKRLGLLARSRAQLAAGGPELAAQRPQVQAATERLARNNVAVERARLSEHVYHSQELPPCPEPVGWHMLTAKELARKGITPAMLNDPASGFKAALYQSAFERPPKLVMACAGTENGPDWTTNLQQGIGLETEQYDRAMKLAQRIIENSRKGTVDMTGHSLGGGLASAASAVTGAKGYTFNAAGLHPATVARAPYNVTSAVMAARGKVIEAYHSTADPLTNLQSGMKGSLGGMVGTAVGWPVAPEALGVPHPLEPAAGWKHGWLEFGHRNPVTTSKNMALEGHGVDPQMVDHIEAQKDQDTATLTQFVGPTP